MKEKLFNVRQKFQNYHNNLTTTFT